MKNNLPTASPLRQLLDTLGQQFDAPLVQTDLVFKTCQSIAMVSADKGKPLPDDVFAEGLNDLVKRQMLSSLAMTTMSIIQQQRLQPRPLVPKSKTV